MSDDNRIINVGFVGNPNCGKTTLFNAFTGAKLKVANWPGVTVERVEGETSYKGRPIRVIDTPGIYSLTSYTIEEKVTRKCIEDGEVDVIINVVDASSLERNLYLTLQLLELKKPVILALNMMDIVEDRGMEIDLHRLPEMLGSIPVVPVSARKRTGLDVLMHAVVHHYEEGPQGTVVKYTPRIENKISKVETVLKAHYGEMDNLRWHAIKFMEYDETVWNDHPVDLNNIIDHNYEKEIINQKYDYIEEIIKECLVNKESKAASTDKIDEFLTHPIWGIPIFLGIMAMVFFLTFTVGDFLKGFFEVGLDWLSGSTLYFLQNIHASEWITSLVVDGIVAGVGAVLGFVPQMLVLFLLLSVLEDCGYMARIAFIMDRIFRRFGLSGKSFIPMLVATGCGVPGIMASRTIEQDRDRKMTIMTTGFIPCGAKMPIIGLFAGALFGGSAWVATSAYFIGVAAVILSGVMLKKTRPFAGEPAPFVMELPAYHAPTAGNVLRATWERGWSFIKRAGTVILASSIILWFLQGFGWENGAFGLVEDMNNSVLAAIGSAVAFIFAPLGFGNWRATVAVVTGLIAKENVVATFGVLYNFAGELSENGDEIWALVAQDYTAISAYSFMIFNLLCAPCFAAMGAIKREMNNAKWTAFAIGYMCVFAYVVSLIVYQIGGLITGEVSFGIGTVVAVVLVVGIVYLLFRKNKYEDERLTIRSVDAAGRRAALK